MGFVDDFTDCITGKNLPPDLANSLPDAKTALSFASKLVQGATVADALIAIGIATEVAEAIAEAPSSSGGVLPLTNFGTVGFTSTLVNGQPIGSFNPDRIDMVSGSTLKAQTSGLSGGTSFSVAWKHA